jgi:hypothetical protein
MKYHLKEEAIGSNNNDFHRKTKIWLTTYQWWHWGYWWTTK